MKEETRNLIAKKKNMKFDCEKKKKMAKKKKAREGSLVRALSLLATLDLKHLDDRCMCVRLWLK